MVDKQRSVIDKGEREAATVSEKHFLKSRRFDFRERESFKILTKRRARNLCKQSRWRDRSRWIVVLSLLYATDASALT